MITAPMIMGHEFGGAIVAVDSGQPLNPILERYGSGLICVSAYLRS